MAKGKKDKSKKVSKQEATAAAVTAATENSKKARKALKDGAALAAEQETLQAKAGLSAFSEDGENPEWTADLDARRASDAAAGSDEKVMRALRRSRIKTLKKGGTLDAIPTPAAPTATLEIADPTLSLSVGAPAITSEELVESGKKGKKKKAKAETPEPQVVEPEDDVEASMQSAASGPVDMGDPETLLADVPGVEHSAAPATTRAPRGPSAQMKRLEQDLESAAIEAQSTGKLQIVVAERKYTAKNYGAKLIEQRLAAMFPDVELTANPDKYITEGPDADKFEISFTVEAKTPAEPEPAAKAPKAAKKKAKK